MGDYSEAEVLWLLSLTADEARSLDGVRTTLAGRRPDIPTSLLWRDVQHALAELGIDEERSRLWALGYTQREIGVRLGVHHSNVSRHVQRTARAVAKFLNEDRTKAA